SKEIPSEFIKVSESGISSINAIKNLKTAGFEGFLIGENFMRTTNPGESALEFIKDLSK
ncbi:MAG: indole-3-glycerol-phosphate synthase, partial [Eudoraea sp.]